jgi:hypothetical protein
MFNEEFNNIQMAICCSAYQRSTTRLSVNYVIDSCSMQEQPTDDINMPCFCRILNTPFRPVEIFRFVFVWRLVDVESQIDKALNQRELSVHCRSPHPLIRAIILAKTFRVQSKEPTKFFDVTIIKCFGYGRVRIYLPFLLALGIICRWVNVSSIVTLPMNLCQSTKYILNRPPTRSRFIRLQISVLELTLPISGFFKT